MYMQGQGHSHWGPGTSLVQFVRPSFGMAGCGGGCASIGATKRCCDSCANRGSCGKGLLGMGIFESGFDISGWGWPELLIAAAAGYMVLSTVFTTGRAVSAVRAYPGKRRSKKAARLRARALELTRKK
jgi:hypothetical protein